MNFLIGYVSNQSLQMEDPFCVYDQASFEIAKTYAFHFRDIEVWELEVRGEGFQDYIATPYQFEAEETYCGVYENYCPNYEERRCSVCGESPRELYLRTSITTTKVRERIYSEVCELVCQSHIHNMSFHPFMSNYTYDYQSVGRKDVTNSIWMSGVEWSPNNHKFFHWEDRETVEAVLLVAKRSKWPLPREIVWMILNYVFTLPTGFQALYNRFGGLHYCYRDVESYQKQLYSFRTTKKLYL